MHNVPPILDELLREKVIQQESYDKIRALPTSQEKMRELYNYLRAGRTCKDIFFNILKKNEPYLIDDLSWGVNVVVNPFLALKHGLPEQQNIFYTLTMGKY